MSQVNSGGVYREWSTVFIVCVSDEVVKLSIELSDEDEEDCDTSLLTNRGNVDRELLWDKCESAEQILPEEWLEKLDSPDLFTCDPEMDGTWVRLIDFNTAIKSEDDLIWDAGMYVCIYLCMYVCTYIFTFEAIYVWIIANDFISSIHHSKRAQRLSRPPRLSSLHSTKIEHFPERKETYGLWESYSMQESRARCLTGESTCRQR